MQYLISYDISDTKIRNKVVKYLESFCYRIQYSVFLCIHTRVRVETIIKQLELLTRNDETKRLLIISIWCNDESFLIKEESVMVV